MEKMLLRTRRCFKLACFFKVGFLLSILTFALVRDSFVRSDVENSLTNGNISPRRGQKLGRILLGIPEEELETPNEDNGNEPVQNCTPRAIHEFPSDGFNREQRQKGWVIIHALAACYCFILLAIVCDDYFIPSIKHFCDNLNMTEDVAGATFMAVASSSSELFINSIGTFVTEGDIGVGTIVGSAVFNILAVPACCGLFANMVLQLDWWPLTRDSLMYGIAVSMLIATLNDGVVQWYEALILVISYIFYIFEMYYNSRIRQSLYRIIRKIRGRNYYTELNGEIQPLLLSCNEKQRLITMNAVFETALTLKDCEELEESTNIWEFPKNLSTKGQAWWILTWPISFVLYCTIPNCRKFPKLYVITFLMCIIWIGLISYVVAWFITVLGDTLSIPDSVMGLTFLAAGTSVPEAVSSIIVTNQGHGGMGVSSSIGSNTFDILLCLGLPWLIKSWFYPKIPGQHSIIINSSGITYSALTLLLTLVLLYSTLAINKFKLDWKVGLSCLAMYVVFLIFATLTEMNFFFQVNLPTCGR